MENWVKVVESKGYQVCIEKGVEMGYPAIVFRLFKDNGILRSKMCLQPRDPSKTAIEMAKLDRDAMFDSLDAETIEAAVDQMLEIEPMTKDGNRHGFIWEPGK
jgi:hypothetical protein